MRKDKDKNGQKRKPNILVIEDNPDNMALIEEILEDEGFNIFKALLAGEGIDILNKNKTDLIIMDISLPEMDGLEATRIIKEDVALKGIPIVALTAHAMPSDRDAALSAGCDDYLTKPIDEKKLLETIKRHLGV